MVELCELVTSFNPPLHQASAKWLLKDHRRLRMPWAFRIYVEGWEDAPAAFPACRSRTLDSDPLLQEFLDRYRRWIPEALGGQAKPCSCPGEDAHIAGCHWTYWRRNAYRWFRKIVSLIRASQESPARYLLWLDCDCRLHRPWDAHELLRWFGLGSVLYMCGKREVPETGVLGLDLALGGREFVQAALDWYFRPEFLQQRCWDDRWAIWDAIRRGGPWRPHDMASGTPAERRKVGHVLSVTRWGEYIAHAKGSHHRGGYAV